MEMLSLHLDRSSHVPLYEQLYIYIKKEITGGRIQYGVKLPSKRKLSDFLKISQNTVDTAYGQLIAEGYIEGVPRKGFYVLAYEDLEFVQNNAIPQPKQRDERTEIQYNFHPSWIDTEYFPFTKWRKYAKETIDQNHHSLLLLGHQQGEFELREQIASYLYQARGVQCTPDEIIVGAGIEILLQQLIQLLDSNTIFGVEDPGYHVITKLLKSYPNEFLPLEVDDEGVKVNDLERSQIEAVYVTPSHHFPYGVALSVNRRRQLLKWASQLKNRFIIEDDYDSEFRYIGKAIPSLKSMDHNEKVIYLGTFSKSLIPSLRVSYMVLPNPLLKKYQEELSFYHCSVSRIDQHLLARFMREGEFERHLNRMKKIYRRKLEKTLDLLKPYQNNIKIIGGNSGFHIVLAVENGMTEMELFDAAMESQIKVYPLSTYSIELKQQSPPKILIGFAGIPEKELEIAIKTLLKTWRLI